MKRILLTCFMLVLVLYAWAQNRTVSGKVTDADAGDALPGVNVLLKGTGTGVTTDLDGNYQINVPGNDAVLVFSFIGMSTQEVSVGSRSVIDVSMQANVQELGEVVVTGVAQGTSTKKLGFAIGKVDSKLIEEVPATDAANALRGKVAGVQIVQSSGNPGTAGSINLRGATSISGSSQQPLIIIDGIVTPPGSAKLEDINMNDVESIEVIKGAAGASLYGSLAGNGVVQIITKRGSKKMGETRITLRNEFGSNEILRKVPLSNSHSFALDANGEYALDENGQRIPDDAQIYDNPYPGQTYDQLEEVFAGRNFYNNYLSIASTQEKTNFMASFDNTVQQGLVEGQDAFERINARLNVDHELNDRLLLKLSSSYINSQGPNPQQGGQSGFIYGALLFEPDINLRSNNPDGQPFITVSRPIGNFTNADNPLYVAHNNIRVFERERFLGGATLNYNIFDWWKLEGQISIDRSNYNEDRLQDKDYLSQSQPNGNGGSIDKRQFLDNAMVANFSSYFNHSFGELNLNSTLRYITEEYVQDFQQTLGTNLASKGIFTLNNVDRNTLAAVSQIETFRAENYMANVNLDYKDRYILDALYRIDRSSLFGKDARSNSFYRTAFAYRISEDLELSGINEWKLRTSIGTSGQRPPFTAQYETYDLQGGSLLPSVLGNTELRPSIITEIELGTNISFLDRFDVEFNYAKSVADDQILLVPLAGYAGFTAQYQNAGTIESQSLELAINAQIINQENLKWNVGITASRTRSKVTDLGRPDYLLNVFNSTPVFAIEEGGELGVIKGNLIASDIDQLTTNEDGFVNNLAGLNQELTPQDFTVNSDGYLIVEGTEYTEDESVYHLLDENGNRLVTEIGNTNSDVLLGLNSSLSYKGFNLFVSMDAQVGGDIANVMRQNLLFNGRAGEVDQSGFPEGQRKYNTYQQSTSNSGNGLNQKFIEDASYTALREVALSYTFSRPLMEKLGKIGNFIHDAKISLVGRNLFMITDYSGFTPDISSTGSVAAGNVDNDVLLNPTIFRADVYGYPLFRSYSAALQLRF